MLTCTVDDDGHAYISLTGSPHWPVARSVPLDSLADEETLDALRSIVLDFDADGRLVGIEIAGDAESVLPRNLLAEKGYDERRGTDGT